MPPCRGGRESSDASGLPKPSPHEPQGATHGAGLRAQLLLPPRRLLRGGAAPASASRRRCSPPRSPNQRPRSKFKPRGGWAASARAPLGSAMERRPAAPGPYRATELVRTAGLGGGGRLGSGLPMGLVGLCHGCGGDVPRWWRHVNLILLLWLFLPLCLIAVYCYQLSALTFCPTSFCLLRSGMKSPGISELACR